MKSLLHNALIVNEGQAAKGWVAYEPPYIVEVGAGDAPQRIIDWADVAADCDGDMVMPGVIDTHVHFRDPGLTAKGDMATESRAARRGGVTSVIDMPNVKPLTVSVDTWNERMSIAAEKSVVNYAFFIGATADNIDLLKELDYTRIPGIKLFLGSSTGNMLLDDDKLLDRLFTDAPAIIAVHAEDEDTIRSARQELEKQYPEGAIPVALHDRLRPVEACTRAARRIVSIAVCHNARLHLLHVSTGEEVDIAAGQPGVTLETCPHYLIFDRDMLETGGARLKCNPAIKDAPRREALLKAVADRRIDTIATDHAPHLPADKAGDLLHAASGMPGVQFSLPLMLSLGILAPERVVEMMSHRPAEIFNIDRRGFLRPGYYADIVRVRRLDEPHVITDSDVVSRCGWTPYKGKAVDYEVITTIVNGHATEKAARPLKFNN